MFYKFKIGKVRFYITTEIMRIRQKRERFKKSDRQDYYHEVIKPLYADRGGRICDVCGKQCSVVIHHILPWSKFSQFEKDFRNLMLVCPDCHSEIHNNPFFESRMISEKAKELGVDISEVYNLKNIPL